MSAEISILSDELWETLREDKDRLNGCVFLESHNRFPRQWAVNSFDVTFRQRLAGWLSKYDTVPFIRFSKFVEGCEEAGYEIIFLEDPAVMYDWLDILNADPGVRIESVLSGGMNRLGEPLEMINGFLKFQAVGVNFQKTCERMCWLQWSTGTGKTVGMEGTILWRKDNGFGSKGQRGFDVCFIYAKPNNLIGTQRKLKEHTGIDAVVVSGTPKKREKTYVEIAQGMINGEQPVVILTYEKLREDREFLKVLVEDHYILNVADEAPTRLRTRGTQIYRSGAEVFYTSFVPETKNNRQTGKKIYYPKLGSERAKQMFSLILSATPIYNSPEDAFSVVRLFDPTIFGSVNDFNREHVRAKNRWGQIVGWKNLDLMGMKMAHVVYQVDKNDQDIAAMFPEVMPEENVLLELHPDDQKLYDKLVSEYEKMKDDELSILSRTEILAAIGCLQMLINNPRGVLFSAQEREDFENELTAFEKHLNVTEGLNPESDDYQRQLADFIKKNKRGSAVALKFRNLTGDDSRFTDRNKDGSIRNSKLAQLIEDIESNDSKVVVFSAANETNLPFIAEALEEAEVGYVLFRGGMSDKARQDAIDTFRTDPSIKVFLSSDAGGDGIDLPEANLTDNYDSTWTDAANEQRNNRQHRIISKHESVRVRSLRTPNSVEDRKAQIVGTKRGYSNEVFKGEIAEQSSDIRSFSKRGLLYLLTGREINVAD